MLHQQVGGFIQSIGNVKFGDAATGSTRKFFTLIGDNRRAVMLFHQSRCRQPHNSRVITAVHCNQQQGVRIIRQGKLLGGSLDFTRDLLAFAVLIIELLRQMCGFGYILGS